MKTLSNKNGHRVRGTRGFAFPLLAVALVVGSFLAGCGERERVTSSEPTDAPGFVDRGWSSFSGGDFEDALADFTQAIGLDPNLGEAYVGQGWSRLKGTPSSTNLTNAILSFQDAQSRGENGAEVRGGIAAAQLGLGASANLNLAISEAQAARTADAAFQFEHFTSFDIKDLWLIEVFARAAQGNLTSAVQLGNNVDPTTLDSGNPSTWVVDGTTFSTFEGAALAYLHGLSEDHSG